MSARDDRGRRREAYPVSTLWQARALVRFVALDWHEGAAAVIMAGTFRLLAMANDDYVAPEPRGQVKVPLGRAVLGYLSERDAGRDGQEFAAITDKLSADKRTQDHDDLSRRAKANFDRMREGRHDLVPYEIL